MSTWKASCLEFDLTALYFIWFACCRFGKDLVGVLGQMSPGTRNMALKDCRQSRFSISPSSRYVDAKFDTFAIGRPEVQMQPISRVASDEAEAGLGLGPVASRNGSGQSKTNGPAKRRSSGSTPAPPASNMQLTRV
jgi:hypothetical protein